MKSNPAAGFTRKLPSVMKNRFPEKSGMVSMPSWPTRTNPGLPPRWETSTWRVPSPRSTYDATKKVSAVAMISRARVSRPSTSVAGRWRVKAGSRTTSRLRLWM